VTSTVRNILIVVAIAAAVFAIPGGGDAASFVAGLLSAGITATFAFIGARFYRENRVAIFSLGDGYRALLYGALALWFALIGGASYALAVVWRYYRSYSF
jgi:hypothetical protein